MSLAVEIVVAVLVLVGTFLMVVSSLGLLRLPDVYCRMHAAGKAGTLGVVLLILAPGVYFLGSDHEVHWRAILAVLFQFLTTPVSVHLLARAAYVSDYELSDRTAVDELKDFLPSRPDEIRKHE